MHVYFDMANLRRLRQTKGPRRVEVHWLVDQCARSARGSVENIGWPRCDNVGIIMHFYFDTLCVSAGGNFV